MKKFTIRQRLLKIRLKGENKRCFHCESRNPTWCSVKHGIWICMYCSGIHRSLGTHICFVRHSVLDNWDSKQGLKYFATMKLGGNRRARIFFTKNGVERDENSGNFPVMMYSSNVAQRYKEKLIRDAEEVSNIWKNKNEKK